MSTAITTYAKNHSIAFLMIVKNSTLTNREINEAAEDLGYVFPSPLDIEMIRDQYETLDAERG